MQRPQGRRRRAAEAVGILVDLQGPKIRLGTLRRRTGTSWPAATQFTITTEDVARRRSTICCTTYKGLAGDCKPGDRILIDDGRVALEVDEVERPARDDPGLEGGKISNNKGINLPGVAVSVPALSEKDELRPALGPGAESKDSACAPT